MLWKLFLVISMAAAIAGCGRFSSVRANVTIPTPDELTLYAIDGLVNPPTEFVTDDQHFRGYKILGKTEINDPAARGHVVKAISDGINESDGTVASCFWPRHGVHTVKDGKAVDYVICYECLQVYVFPDGEDDRMHPTTEKHQAVLTDRLTAAGIKLAPSIEEKLSNSK
jgi:hypothetical protein